MATTKKINLILLIVAIAIVSWYAISLSKNQVQPVDNNQTQVVNSATSTEPIVTATSTKDWLTYRNEEYGFEVKYPGEWKENKTINKNYQLCLVDKEKKYYVEMGDECLTAVSVQQNKDNYKELIEIINIKPETLKTNVKDITIDGQKGRQVINYLGVETIVLYKNQIYYILSPNFGSEKINSQINDIYTKIISTFKFTN